MRGEPLPARTLYAMRTKEADVVLAEKWAVLEGPDKYIVTAPPKEEEFYDLVHDPREQTNLAARAAVRVAAGREQLERFKEQTVTYEREFVDLGVLSSEMTERLRSLGYVH